MWGLGGDGIDWDVEDWEVLWFGLGGVVFGRWIWRWWGHCCGLGGVVDWEVFGGWGVLWMYTFLGGVMNWEVVGCIVD